jgi:predicted AlkP superfamily phosphohydrolase/phosphomutase
MARTVLIGLDGATFTVLNSLFETGEMPFLREFMARGAYAELNSTVHPLTPAAWTSMITGRTPGNHGIFDFIHCRQASHGIFYTLNMSYDIRCPTVWSMLSRQGMRVACLNFPVAFPPEPINGICVPGFVNVRHLNRAVYPPSFFEVMKRLPGFDAEFMSMDINQELQSIQHLKEDEYEPWITYHIRREEQWANLIRFVLTDDPPDFTGFILDGVDKLQHLCWRFLDPVLRPTNPTAWEARIIDLCLSYFRRLDGLLRDIVTAAGPETRIFVASDHGFGATETVFFANAWLAQKGYLTWHGKTGNSGPSATDIAEETIKSQVEKIDWDQTLAFALNPSCNGIYIRRSDAHGISAEKYQAFRATLQQELLALTNPFTGEPFFSRVLTREQAFSGEFPARAPDLTLLMKDHGFLSVLHSDEIFRRRAEPWGTHYPEGIFIAGGPGIASLGPMPALEICDVAPILLRSLGAVPEGEMEGCCPEALFDLQPNPEADNLKVASAGALQGQEQNSYADVEEEVLKRLQLTGYLLQ